MNNQARESAPQQLRELIDEIRADNVNVDPLEIERIVDRELEAVRRTRKMQRLYRQR